MKATRLAVLSTLLYTACGGSTPAAPTPSPPTSAGGLTISGTVYAVDATGRRPLAGALVELADSTTAIWGEYGRPTSDTRGWYSAGSLTPRHYLARASRTGYTTSAVISLGYVEASKTVDFELTVPSAPSATLSVASISPTTGSTGGGTTVRIVGTGLSNAKVTFDGAAASVYAENSTALQATTPGHGAGPVDVVVTGSSGQTVTLAGAYTYASPQSFDFNGTWIGSALAHPDLAARVVYRHSDMDMKFTIQNNTVTSFTCGGSELVTSPPPSVSNGEFSLAGNGVAVSGRIVAPAGAAGTINTAACPSTRWTATKQ